MDEVIPGSGLMYPPQAEADEPELELAKKCKRNGYSAKKYMKMRGDGIRLTARALKWNSAQLDEAFIALATLTAIVWGEQETTRGLAQLVVEQGQ